MEHPPSWRAIPEEDGEAALVTPSDRQHYNIAHKVKI
jgi:hypothetical protein